uniref:Uncharacterized protein n=1 Tax=Moschus moschiferus TaxID=68415 RepID=A0A8C6FQ39_MOSMO
QGKTKNTGVGSLSLFMIIPWGAPYSLDSIIDKKIKNLIMSGPPHSQNQRNLMSVSHVPTQGLLSLAVACGYTCGSWDIRKKTTCHVQCNPVDWTTACCCHLT